MAGLVGMGLLVMGMAASPQREHLEIDKALHVGGYCTLGALLVLALRPAQFVPGLLALGGLSVVLEHVQVLVGRSFERRDLLANAVGIAVGAALGLLVRGVHSYLRRELASARIRRRLLRLRPGDTLFVEGAAGSDFYLVRRGEVELRRLSGGSGPPLGVFGPGDVVGVAAAILAEPRAATARAVSPASVLPMTLPELIEATGGRGQPVAVVLGSLAEKLRELLALLDAAERLAVDVAKPGTASQ